MGDDDNSVGSVVANKEIGNRLKRRVLCQARGLSQDHNANTAFIDIPLDAPHGLLLVCSHAECAKSHRRFRYCKVFDEPVAKQNFYQRHGHGLIDTLGTLKKIDEENADLAELSSCLSSLPPLDEAELAGFIDWIQNSEDIF